MGYIRTDRGIYEIESAFVNNEGEFVGYNIVDDFMIILRNQVIKSAYTIEELCDEFRYKYDNVLTHERCWRSNPAGVWIDCETYLPLDKEEISTIKGAIWTDTGLIYVAKLNDKGEFELL